jgi:hypothetical protein
MSQTPVSDIPQRQGTDRVYDVLLTTDGTTPITTFTDQATLAASISLGGGQPVIAALVAVWVDPSAGTLTLTIPAVVSATLSPGRYQVILEITANGVIYDALPEGCVDIVAAPAAPGTPIVTYCDLADMMAQASWITICQGAEVAGGFLMQRVQATQWINDQIMSRAQAAYTAQLGLHEPLSVSDPIVPTAGVDAGPGYGASTIPYTTTRDQLTTIAGYLEAGYLMRDSALDGGKTRRLCAEWAIYLACATQIGRNTDTPFVALGDKFYSRALRTLYGWIARIDTDADGIANLEIRG